MTSKLTKLGCSRPKLDRNQTSLPILSTSVLNLDTNLTNFGTHPLEADLTELEPQSQKLVDYQSKLKASLPRLFINRPAAAATEPASLDVKYQPPILDNLGTQQVREPTKDLFQVMTHTITISWQFTGRAHQKAHFSQFWGLVGFYQCRTCPATCGQAGGVGSYWGQPDCWAAGIHPWQQPTVSSCHANLKFKTGHFYSRPKLKSLTITLVNLTKLQKEESVSKAVLGLHELKVSNADEDAKVLLMILKR